MLWNSSPPDEVKQSIYWKILKRGNWEATPLKANLLRDYKDFIDGVFAKQIYLFVIDSLKTIVVKFAYVSRVLDFQIPE